MIEHGTLVHYNGGGLALTDDDLAVRIPFARNDFFGQKALNRSVKNVFSVQFDNVNEFLFFERDADLLFDVRARVRIFTDDINDLFRLADLGDRVRFPRLLRAVQNNELRGGAVLRPKLDERLYALFHIRTGMYHKVSHKFLRPQNTRFNKTAALFRARRGNLQQYDQGGDDRANRNDEADKRHDHGRGADFSVVEPFLV